MQSYTYYELLRTICIESEADLSDKIAEVWGNEDFSEADKLGAIKFYIDAYCEASRKNNTRLEDKAMELLRWVGL